MVWGKTERAVNWCLLAPEGLVETQRRSSTRSQLRYCIGVRDQVHALAGLLRGKERPELLFLLKSSGKYWLLTDRRTEC